MGTTLEHDVGIVGYQGRGAGGGRVLGTVEGVRPRGVRVHKIPGHAGHHGYLPAEAIARIDRSTDTVLVRPGIDLERLVDAPPPPDESPDGWHMSNDWWADLLGHYGLFSAEGRGGEPFLHPDQR